MNKPKTTEAPVMQIAFIGDPKERDSRGKLMSEARTTVRIDGVKMRFGEPVDMSKFSERRVSRMIGNSHFVMCEGGKKPKIPPGTGVEESSPDDDDDDEGVDEDVKEE